MIYINTSIPIVCIAGPRKCMALLGPTPKLHWMIPDSSKRDIKTRDSMHCSQEEQHATNTRNKHTHQHKQNVVVGSVQPLNVVSHDSDCHSCCQQQQQQQPKKLASTQTGATPRKLPRRGGPFRRGGLICGSGLAQTTTGRK
jgi:hypothetical protein